MFRKLVPGAPDDEDHYHNLTPGQPPSTPTYDETDLAIMAHIEGLGGGRPPFAEVF